jgi:hypothetical protein
MTWAKLLTEWDIDDTYRVTDPHQGLAPNCALIAALSSLAWVGKSLIEQQTNEPTTIPFYSTQGERTDVSVDWKLCYNENSVLVYAHSINAEIWPAIYEKAYGKWLNPDFNSCSSYENTDWGGNPCTALTNLTGKASTTKYTAGKLPATIRTDIRYKCYAAGKTIYPMVAWTYPNLESDYGDILAAHSYSLLGLYPTKTGTEIVLRNPMGHNADAVGNPTAWNGIGIGKDGIFKVPEIDFQQQFMAYGWVVA